MNINSQEQNALFTSKLIEGKDEITAKNEIFRDLKFIKDFQTLKRDNEREIRELERIKAKLLKEIEKSRQTLLKKDLAISQPREHKTFIDENYGAKGTSNLANTVIIKRVIHYLEEHPNTDSNKIAEFCCINHPQAIDAQNFINKYIRR